MKILGIDASGMVASVAIVEDDIVVGEYSTNFKKTHRHCFQCWKN